MIDNALKLAGLEVCRIENERYAAFESSDICVPGNVDAEIKGKIASHRRRRALKSRAVNIACIAAVVLLISSAVLTVNVEARNKITRLIRRMFGSTVEYVKNPDNTDNSPQLHLSGLDVNWIPEGFELDGEFVRKNSVKKLYKGANAAILVSASLVNKNLDRLYASPDGTPVASEIGEYNGCAYEFISANESSRTNNLIIIDKSEEYYVTIDSSLNREIIFKIYDNLTIIFEK